MKKSAFIFFIAVAVCLGSAYAMAQQSGFTAPILVGGDGVASQSTGGAGGHLDQKVSQATHLNFFMHPQLSAGANKRNYVEEPSKIDLPGFPNNIFLGDLSATPGRLDDPNKAVLPDAPSVEQLPKFTVNGAVLDPTNGVGPAANNATSTLSMIRYQLANETMRNQKSHHLMLGDVRKQVPADKNDEFQTLFGVPPLEDFLIGNAAGTTELPYDADKYPAAIMRHIEANGVPYKLCAVMDNDIAMNGDSACPPELRMGPDYDEVYLYDLADVGTGMASVSYDPLSVGVMGETCDAAKGACKPLNSNAPMSMPYFSPLALFRVGPEVLAGPSSGGQSQDKRYRLTGYTSWEMDQSSSKTKTHPITLQEMTQVAGYVPIFTNPISVDSINLGGASSGGKVAGFVDTDLAVVGRTVLFDLNKPVYDDFGRPAVLAEDFAHHAQQEILFAASCVNFDATTKIEEIKCDSPPQPSDYEKITEDLFPDSQIAPVLFRRQVKQWLPSDQSTGPYEQMNPSSVFRPLVGSIVGPNAYSAAVLTDNPNGNRKQYLVVPSATFQSCPSMYCNKAVMYLIDPLSKWHIFVKKSTRTPSTLGSGNVCSEPVITYEDTHFVMPSFFTIATPYTADRKYVPYQVRAGDLDKNDPCADLIVTWRGADTKSVGQGGERKFIFDDGKGTAFSNIVTIVERKWNGTECKAQAQVDLPVPGDFVKPVLPEVASADLGDFDGDGVTDIIAGNQRPENVQAVDCVKNNADCNKATAYAYLFKGPLFSTLNGSYEHVRTGFKADAADKLFGVADIKGDKTARPANTPDAVAQINGLALALEPIGCPAYLVPSTDIDVGSIAETVAAFAFTQNAATVNSKGTPVYDENALMLIGRPYPMHCLANQQCAKTVFSGAGYNSGPHNVQKPMLPFFEGDPCCADVYDTADKACCKYLEQYDECLYEEFLSKGLCGSYGDNRPLNSEPSKMMARGTIIIENPSTALSASSANPWRPDEVVASSDRHAIASAGALAPAAGGNYQINKTPGYNTGIKDIGQLMIYNPYPSCDPACVSPKICIANGVCKEVKMDVKLPKGLVPPGHREITALARKQVDCNHNDKTDLATEECDGADVGRCTPVVEGVTYTCSDQCKCQKVLPECLVNGKKENGEACDLGNKKYGDPGSDTYMKELFDECPHDDATLAAKGQLNDCEINCTCNYVQPRCPVNPDTSKGECNDSSDCPGSYCDSTCTCHASSQRGDCFVKVKTSSSKEAEEATNKANREVNAVNHRSDDVFGEFEQEMTVTCFMPAPSGSGKSMTIDGPPPHMLVQYSGSKFLDSQTLEFNRFELVDTKAPLRLAPLEQAEKTSGKAIVLPDLSSSSDLAAVSPMADAVVRESGPTMMINNMVQFSAYAVPAGGTMPVGTESIVLPDIANLDGFYMYVTDTRMPPDCAHWTGTEGYVDCPVIEKRLFDKQQVIKDIQAKMALYAAEGKTPTSEVNTGITWEANGNYMMGIVQSQPQQGKAMKLSKAKGETLGQQTIDQRWQMAIGPWDWAGTGGGCHCSMGPTGAFATEGLPLLLVSLSGLAGAFAARRRMKKK